MKNDDFFQAKYQVGMYGMMTGVYFKWWTLPFKVMNSVVQMMNSRFQMLNSGPHIAGAPLIVILVSFLCYVWGGGTVTVVKVQFCI